jgi:SAM-dependent MidA family methyltransferase
MFDQKLKILTLEAIANSNAVKKAKIPGCNDALIKILCPINNSNRNNFLVNILLQETNYDVHLIGHNNNYLIENHQYRHYNLLKSPQTNELDLISSQLKEENYDIVIFDYFLDETSNPSTIAELQNKIITLHPKLEIILPFRAQNFQDNNLEIITSLSANLINFSEIFEKNHELLNQINQEKTAQDLVKLENLITTSYLLKNIDYCLRHLVSKSSHEIILSFIIDYGDKISRKMLLHCACNLLNFCSDNDALIDKFLELAQASNEEISQIVIHNFNKIYHLRKIEQNQLDSLQYLLQRFSDFITPATKDYLIDNTQRVDFLNEKLFSFLIDKFNFDAAKALIEMLSFSAISNSGSGSIIQRIDYIFQNHQNKISKSDLNLALLEAQKHQRSPETIELLIKLGANREIINNNKNYGWSKFLDPQLAKNLTPENISWVSKNFASYVEAMNDFLFDESYGYYASGIVKIGGNAADFSTNVTNGKGFAYLLTLSAAQKWLEVKKPKKFIILELCGGNGKLANDILTIAEILSHNIDDLAGFFIAVTYRTVDISAALSKVQQKRNKKFAKKFEVILSDASDKKWLENFEFKDCDGIVFCNELVDQFIPDFSIIKDVSSSTSKAYTINYLLVNNFDDFYALYKFENKFLLNKKDAQELYFYLKESSNSYKEKLKNDFEINCAVDENLIINKKDFREKIILPILKPRLDRARLLRYKIFELEEEIEERKRNSLTNFKYLELEIENLIIELEPLKQEMLNVWNHFFIYHLMLPSTEKIDEIDLKFARKSSAYPDGYRIAYHELQLKNTLEIIASLKKCEFLIFEYGKLPHEVPARDIPYYGFSYLLNGEDLHFGLQKKLSKDDFSDIGSKLFLGVDITIELDFPKLEEMAKLAGFGSIGTYGDQKKLDDHLRNSNLELYKKALEVLKNNPDFTNLKNEINAFRNYHADFKVIELLG